MNTMIRNFENSIINFINESGIPFELARVILENVLNQVKEEANKAILEEQKEQQKGEEDAESA
jgi:hypothetical protein